MKFNVLVFILVSIDLNNEIDARSCCVRPFLYPLYSKCSVTKVIDEYFECCSDCCNSVTCRPLRPPASDSTTREPDTIEPIDHCKSGTVFCRSEMRCVDISKLCDCLDYKNSICNAVEPEYPNCPEGKIRCDYLLSCISTKFKCKCKDYSTDPACSESITSTTIGGTVSSASPESTTSSETVTGDFPFPEYQ